MIQQTYEYVSWSLWYHLMFLKLALERVSCHGNSILKAVGAFPLKLLPYQVSMVCDANWPR